jgi:glycosyltransferase involved in cell wall biosynthesis
MPPSPAAICYSIVIPVLNEAEVLPVLLARIDALIARLDGPAEVLLVDDGSTDGATDVIRAKAEADPRYRLVQLSRNFGHQAAITAGMDLAAGQAVVVMDADLQDPPEVVLELAAKWREGCQVVYAQRTSREGETAFKRWTAHLFYAGLRRLTSITLLPNVGDFRLVDRKVLEAFRAMPERDRFVRGMFGWLGFRQGVVPFARAARAAGATKYPLWKMIRLATSGLVGFSDAPLRVALWLGLAVSTLAIVYGGYVLVAALSGDGRLVAGWASTIVIVSFLCGLNMMLTGIVGLYVGRIHSEVKGRPLYVINEKVGFEHTRVEPAPSPSASAERHHRAQLAAG